MVAVPASREGSSGPRPDWGSASDAGVLRKHGGSGTIPRAWLSLSGCAHPRFSLP